MIFILGGLILVLSHKIFGLITHLPEHVTRWIGQQTQNLGEQQDEQRTRAIFAGATSKGEGAGTSMVRQSINNNNNDKTPGAKTDLLSNADYSNAGGEG